MTFTEELKSLAYIPLEYSIKWPCVMVAQGLLETGRGAHLAAPNNCFGRKFKPGFDPPESEHTVSATKEYIPDKDPEDDGKDGWKYLGDGWWEKSLAFKKYVSLAACVHDWSLRVSKHPIYADAANAETFEEFIQAVARHWATDPKYLDKLYRLIEQEGLREIDITAGTMGALPDNN